MSTRPAFHRPNSTLMAVSLALPKLPPGAACANPNLNPDDWFPENGRIPAVVRRTCLTCPVQAECLEAGLREKFGIWGGFSEQARATMAGRYARPPAPPASPICPTCGRTFPNARSRAGHQPYCKETR